MKRDPFAGQLDATRRAILKHLSSRGGHFVSHAEVRAMPAYRSHLAIVEIAAVEGGHVTDAHRAVGRGPSALAAMNAALQELLAQIRAGR